MIWFFTWARSRSRSRARPWANGFIAQKCQLLSAKVRCKNKLLKSWKVKQLAVRKTLVLFFPISYPRADQERALRPILDNRCCRQSMQSKTFCSAVKSTCNMNSVDLNSVICRPYFPDFVTRNSHWFMFLWKWQQYKLPKIRVFQPIKTLDSL